MVERAKYGSFHRSEKSLVVLARPDVRMKLKRWFNRDGATDRVIVSDTPHHCRELLFFLGRYPMEASDADLAYLQEQGDAVDRAEERFHELAAGDGIRETFDLRIPLRDYQKTVPAIVLETRGLLCGDDLGLGKTAQGIALLADGRARPGLVVCPKHLQTQWAREIARFAPNLRTHIIKKGTPYDLRKGRGKRVLPLPDVIISTYGKFVGWVDAFRKIGIRSVIWEEAHELRHRGTLKHGAAFEVRQMVEYALGLTATPVYNTVDEVHNIMEVIRPGSLGDITEFRREWPCDATALGIALRDQGLFIRRTKKEVGRELPKIQRIPTSISSDTSALEAIHGTARELATYVLERGQARLAPDEQAALFAAQNELLMILRQMTGIAKAPHVANFVRMLAETGQKVLLGGWHRAVYDIWLDALKDLKPVMYTGTESERQKDAARTAFIEGDAQVLILSNRSGSGLDGLQYICSTSVHGELDWSPQVHRQFDGRIHRDGQEEPVQAFYMVTDIGSDPVIAELLGIKDVVARGIMDPGGEGDFDLEEVSEKDARARFRMLAESYLEQQGIKVPKAAPAAKTPARAKRSPKRVEAPRPEPERPQREQRRGGEQMPLLAIRGRGA